MPSKGYPHTRPVMPLTFDPPSHWPCCIGTLVQGYDMHCCPKRMVCLLPLMSPSSTYLPITKMPAPPRRRRPTPSSISEIGSSQPDPHEEVLPSMGACCQTSTRLPSRWWYSILAVISPHYFIALLPIVCRLYLDCDKKVGDILYKTSLLFENNGGLVVFGKKMNRMMMVMMVMMISPPSCMWAFPDAHYNSILLFITL
jgi:hypothetical protein